MDGPDKPKADINWTDGVLRSTRFNDVYFSLEGGLAESRTVFLQGCGLPERWAEQSHFTVAELGLGTGLNMLATLGLWREIRPEDARLSLFSIEGFPLSPEDAAQALSAFPEVSDLAEPLLAQWPKTAGWHRIRWPELNATLDLAVGGAEAMLVEWQGKADAWFLDGFAPSQNPAMWTPELMALVATRSAPGARAATYTVAGSVRRGLQAAGFALERQPGFGRKRERLEAQLPGTKTAKPLPKVAIIGAGIAASSLARAFREAGVEPTLYADGKGASHNLAALISPRLPSEKGANLHLQAFRDAVQLVEETAPDAIIRRGMLRFARNPREERNLQNTAEERPDLFRFLTQEQASEMLGETSPGPALAIDTALVVEPANLHTAWAPKATPAHISEVRKTKDGWALLSGEDTIAEADVVVIAAGLGSIGLASLPMAPVRGQLTTADLPLEGATASDGHYLIPTRTGLLFGATHHRGDSSDNQRPEDTAHNLEKLARLRPGLARQLEDHPLKAEAGVRALPPGALPYAGKLDDGLFLLTGFGGRGFALAPLLATHVVAEALGHPSPLPASSTALLDPKRPR